MERTVFDEEGQFLTGSFTDYGLPRASDAVMFQVDSHPVPAKTNRRCERMRRPVVPSRCQR